MLTCLENIIGLSTNDCPCLEDDRPANYDVSKSGLYIDQHLSVIKLDYFKECGSGSIWKILDDSRTQAIKDFTADFLSRVMRSNHLRYPATREDVGKRSWKTTAPDRNVQGIRICSSNIKGGCLLIHNIKTLFDSAGSFDITITRVLDDGFAEVVDTVTVNTVANTLTQNVQSTPIELDLYDESCEEFEYYITFDTALKPLNNQLDCNCKKNKNEILQWVEMNGVYNDTLNFTNFKTDALAHGLVLDLEAKCKIQDIICENELCFDSDPFAVVMAHAINYYAASLSLQKASMTSEINRFTMLSDVQLKGKIKEYREEYFSRLEYLETNMPFDGVDCLACGGKSTIRKGGILS